MRRMSQFRSPSGYRSSYYESGSVFNSASSDLNGAYDDAAGYAGSPRFQRSARRSSFIPPSYMPNVTLYDRSEPIGEEYAGAAASGATVNDGMSYGGGLMNGICSECGEFRYLVQCLSHCNLILCEGCQNKHWTSEVNELMQVKVQLEDSVSNMRKYLQSKKQQCNDNIKSCQQIKKFISMTMQQIKRKIELELENKRDELYDTIDSFVDNQKKVGQSINEEGFQNTDRICQEIDNILLTTGDQMNFFKVKTVKGLANLQAEKLEKENSKKIPFYSIFFVPDLAIQVQNSFGKIILKSYDEDDFDVDLYTTNSAEKPLKNKIIDQVKAEKLQKWNSAESLHNKKLQLGPFKYNTPSSKPTAPTAPPKSCMKTTNYDDIHTQLNDVSSVVRDPATDQTYVTDYHKLSASSSSSKVRNQSAPVTRLRRKADDAVYSASQTTDFNSGNIGNEDYFKLFEPKKRVEVQVQQDTDSDNDDDDNETDIVSI